MELSVFGLNHRTAPVEIREQFAFTAEQIPQLLAALRARVGLDEALVLSTCNRFEIYAVRLTGSVTAEEILETVQAVRSAERPVGIAPADLEQICSSVYTRRNEVCVHHAMRVASSLDSLVVGETEIVGQVKKAYQLAQECGATGKVLNRLFQKALSVSKQVRTGSGIGRCSTSVGSVALDLAMKIFGEDLSQRTILIIGAGQMGETTLKHLAKHGVKSILVANRSYERASELVSRFEGEAIPLADLGQALEQADIVVSSTSAPDYVLRRPDVARAIAQRPDRPLLLIDLAVPRDIEPEAAAIESVYLYNVDQLSALAQLNLERRQSEAAACEAMVARHAQELAAKLITSQTAGLSQPVKEAWNVYVCDMLRPGCL